MAEKTSLLFALIFLIWILGTCLSDRSLVWRRDVKFDGLVKKDGYPYTQITGEGVNARSCAARCSSVSRCASFFFTPVTTACILNDLVFAATSGSISSPGALYFKASPEGCPQRDGFVWMPGQSLCFKIYLTSTTFHFAYGNCTNVGSRLVVMDTAGKVSAVKTYLAYTYGSSVAVYVGAVRDGVVDGTRTSWNSDLHPLRWLNGALVATSGPDSGWGAGYPTNTGGVEGCMELASGKWNDLPCSYSRRFVCEKVVN